MELWYYIFEVKYYDDYETPWVKREDRGIICAPNKKTVIEKLEAYFGDNIYDVRVYDVEMDTNEILLEKNFPGIIGMMENPKEE